MLEQAMCRLEQLLDFGTAKSECKSKSLISRIESELESQSGISTTRETKQAQHKTCHAMQAADDMFVVTMVLV